MKFNRRQLLMGGLTAGIATTMGADYKAHQKQKQLQALAKEQMPQDQESLLNAAFQADAEKIYQGQQIMDSLKLKPPEVPYDRELSKLLIQCSKIATQQYLTGKTIPTYDGSINSLSAYSSNLDRYTQIASFKGKEAETSQTVMVDISNNRSDSSDPLQRNLDNAETQVGNTIGEMVKLTKETPVYLGFVLTSPENNIIVFRGTQTRVEWVNNLTAVQKDFTDPISGQYFGKVHQGFLKNYQRILQPLPREVAQNFDLAIPCYVTGHSLGSSLAILAALDLALNIPKLKSQIQLYTYASPRVGDPTFATLHAEQVPNSYRIANLADVFTLVPPTQAVGTYVHVGQEWSFLSQNGDFMPNHVVDTYRAAVQREVETDSSRNYPISGL
ncbi:putative lipase [Xenococcus sp. PCC 7305]|uniref:lipase family protein n=1 Tax=Xenococcus sp. PCC 7305 TaxID=102125 RepID=UPI0002AD1B10|nr:DUF2974 domain-containing protein [Xenococcus sp. PCC 7305]ELS02951.1 putative lipase [Xenococcus sp. PCC 7305]